MMNDKTGSDVSVFLVDDHPLVRRGLAMILEQEEFRICGEAGGIQELLAHPGLAAARIVILDLSLDDENGIEIIPALRERGMLVIVYSMHDDAAVVRRALNAGAHGYITKREAGRSLIEAIRGVLDGKIYISPRSAAVLAEEDTGPELSPQQQQLYILLGLGLDLDEIAQRLNIKPRTVETYCVRLMDKLGVNGMRALRRQAISDSKRRRI